MSGNDFLDLDGADEEAVETAVESDHDQDTPDTDNESKAAKDKKAKPKKKKGFSFLPILIIGGVVLSLGAVGSWYVLYGQPSPQAQAAEPRNQLPDALRNQSRSQADQPQQENTELAASTGALGSQGDNPFSMPESAKENPTENTTTAAQVPGEEKSKTTAAEPLNADATFNNQAPTTASQEDIETLKQSQESMRAQLDKVVQTVSELKIAMQNQPASNKNAGIPEGLNQTLQQMREMQSAYSERLAQIEQRTQGGFDKVESEFSSVEEKLQSLSQEVSDIGERNKIATPSRLTGDDIEIMSVTDGFAFLRYADKPSSEFSLRVGEQLNGYGRVEKITALGCIIAGGSKIEPRGGVCEL